MHKHIILLSAVFFFTSTGMVLADTSSHQQAKAIFAGGCFWCMEADFEALPGVIDVISGYTGGKKNNPTYKEVSGGTTGHVEAVQISYDPEKISYEKLLEFFWHNIDPTNDKGQFCDTGNQYQSAIFYIDEIQKHLAEQSKAIIEQNKSFPETIKTKIRPVSEFFPAEQRHQNYHQKHSLSYNFYRFTCGRDRRLKELWVSD